MLEISNWHAYKHILKLLLLFLVIATVSSFGQSNLVCEYCGKKITGRYIEADNKYFHPQHFICSGCKKVISGSFMLKDDNFYHPDCYSLSEGLVCGYCKKIIKGGYVESSGIKYHQNCYENNVVPKCAVCGKPLIGRYTVDIFNNMYHAFHNDEFNKCDNCGRLICSALTGEGRDYSDGRHMCNICCREAVFNVSKINSLLEVVISQLKYIGLTFNDKNISIKAVDLSGLRQAAGNSFDKNMRGFCQSNEESKFINHILSGKKVKHTIFVLNGIPSINIESIIAHELMHIWMNENTKNNHSDALKEGSCNFISFLYLNSLKSTKAEQVIKLMEEDQDDVYGGGFRKVKSKFESQSINRLLDYLKANRSI